MGRQAAEGMSGRRRRAARLAFGTGKVLSAGLFPWGEEDSCQGALQSRTFPVTGFAGNSPSDLTLGDWNMAYRVRRKSEARRAAVAVEAAIVLPVLLFDGCAANDRSCRAAQLPNRGIFNIRKNGCEMPMLTFSVLFRAGFLI
jgi:hypothetical protein